MRQIINNLAITIYNLSNIIFMLLAVWMFYVVLGISLFRDKLGYCSSPENYNIGKSGCQELSLTWLNHTFNFDTIAAALIFLYEISIFEDFGMHLQVMANSGDSASGPVYE